MAYPRGSTNQKRRSVHRLATALLPVVRRTLQVGDGPPFVLTVARSLGVDLAARADWTRGDEQLARTLARRAGLLLARRNEARCRSESAINGLSATVAPATLASTVHGPRGGPWKTAK